MGAVENPFGKRVGGSLCLDFVNTVRGRISRSASRNAKDYADRVIGERLVSYDALLRWGTTVSVLTTREAKSLSATASATPSKAAAVLKRSLTLREAMYRVFKAALEGWAPRPGDLAALNRELQTARMHERLVGSPRPGWDWDETMTLDRVLWPVVRSAGELLTSADLERVGQCPGDECGWLFLDTSRARRRQWCDMAQCGNLAKVRRFRQKRRRQHPRARA
jgi:predicted RNA-binding Zn ribbon-like protein